MKKRLGKFHAIAAWLIAWIGGLPLPGSESNSWGVPAETVERARREIVEMIAGNRPLAEICEAIRRLGERIPNVHVSLCLWGHFPLRLLADTMPAEEAEELCGVALAEWERGGLKRERIRYFGIRRGMEVTGAILVQLSENRRLSPAEENLFDLVVWMAEVAIQHQTLLDRTEYQSRRDELTGIPDRSWFLRRLHDATERAGTQGETLAVFYLDLDRFKVINDHLGCEIGDILLRQVARRLELWASTVAASVARAGGDAFLILLPQSARVTTFESEAEGLVVALNPPFDADGHEVFLSVSVGITIFPDDAADPETLLRRAEAAMERGKSNAGQSCLRFMAKKDTPSRETLILETDLHRALERGELSLRYQPQFDLRNGGLTGREALLQWQHPTLGYVTPGQFIPIAEENGLIIPIGKWVLQEACRQNREWIDSGLAPAKIAVNVSAVQFERAEFAESVASVLASTGMPAHLLELELTETMVLRDAEMAGRHLARLKPLGVRLAVDDFGVGYSSLSYLQDLPLDLVKIDRRFVEALRENPRSHSLVQAIVDLAHGLGMRVVAEGVESREQLKILGDLDCDEAQGFLLGRPHSADLASQIASPASTQTQELAALLAALHGNELIQSADEEALLQTATHAL